MYEAEDNKVYVIQNGERELFLTVHPTDTGGTKTVQDNAKTLAEILNKL